MTTRNDSMIQVFEHPQFGEIRVSGTSDQPLFCLADICKVLEIKNVSMAKRHLRNGGVKIIEGTTFAQKNQYDETGMERLTFLTFISEQNLYRLVMRSNKPQAEPFQDWVCGEVLPAIRKRGAYVLAREGDTEADIRRRAEEAVKAALEQKDKIINEQKALLENRNCVIHEQEALLENRNCVIHEQKALLENKGRLIAEQETEIDRLLPKALYTDNVLESISCYTTTQIAKELGMTAQELNRQLCALRIQYYQSGQYLLYADYAHRGLARSRTHYQLYVGPDTVCTRMSLVWTEKGRKFIHEIVDSL